jgi:hypothetical protein
MTGDYNLPNVTFSNNCNGHVFNGIHSDKADAFFECCQLNGLFQYNNNLNNSGSILDLIFSNISNSTVVTTKNVLVSLDTYHPALVATFESINFKIKVNANLNTEFNFTLANYNLICRELNKIDWDSLLNDKCINNNISLFYDILYQVINKYVPTFSNNIKYKCPTWFNNELKQCIFKKKSLHAKFKISKIRMIINYFPISSRSFGKLMAQMT